MKTLSYSLGKKCNLCGKAVDNTTKILTCQECRAKRAKMIKSLMNYSGYSRSEATALVKAGF